MSETKSLDARLLEVQRELKVEKSQYNSFGKYSYRSKEDILEAAKPLCHEKNMLLLVDDEPLLVGSWVYIKSTASVRDIDTGETLVARGLAREQESRKGMDASQITGTASSYAGKRALGNLFAIDDTKDADASHSDKKEVPASGPFVARCRSCGTAYQFESQDQYKQFVANPQCCPNPMWEVQ